MSLRVKIQKVMIMPWRFTLSWVWGLVLVFGFVVVVTPFWLGTLGISLNGYDLRRLCSLFWLVWATLPLLALPSIRQFILMQLGQVPKGTLFALGLFFLLGVLSSFFAVYPRYALLQVANYALMCLAGLSLAGVLTCLGYRAFWGLWAMVSLGVAVLIVTRCILYAHILEYFAHMSPAEQASLPPDYVNKLMVNPTFAQLRFLAQFITWTWPLLTLPLWVSVQSEQPLLKWAKGFALVLASLWWSVAILNQSRALMLEWLIVACAVLWLFRGVGRKWLVWQVITALIGFVIFWLQYRWGLAQVLTAGHASAESLVRGGSYFADNRLLLYRLALSMIVHHPVLGVGPMHFAYYAFSFGRQNAAHPHDMWLMFAAEWGVPAALALLYVFVRVWHGLFAHGRAQGQTIRQAGQISLEEAAKLSILACFLAGSFHAFVSGVLIMPLSQVMAVIIGAAAFSLFKAGEVGNLGAKFQSWQHGLLVVLVLVTMITIGRGVIPVWGHWQSNIIYFLNAANTRVVDPNFWQQGWMQFWK